MKKILIYNDSKHSGGHELIFLHALRGLCELGTYSISFMVNKHNKCLIEKVQEFPEISIITINYVSKRIQNIRSIFSFYSQIKLYKLLKENNPDAVVVLQGNIEYGSICLIIAKLLGIKKIISYIPITHRLAEVSRYRVIGLIKDTINLFYFKIPSHFITINYAMQKEIRARTSKPIFVIKNGIDFTNFQLYEQKDAQERLKWDISKFHILFLGRIEFSHKGHDILLNAISKNKEFIADLRIHIVGTGSDSKNLKAFIKRNNLDVFIDVNPWTSNPSLLYSACDMVVLPSRFEGTPLTIIEAMYFEKTIVASNIKGINEELPKEWLFEYENSSDLFEKINTNRKINKSIIKTNKERVLKEFEVSNFKRRFVTQIQQIIHES